MGADEIEGAAEESRTHYVLANISQLLKGFTSMGVMVMGGYSSEVIEPVVDIEERGSMASSNLLVDGLLEHLAASLHDGFQAIEVRNAESGA